jgi:hypothetical protein
MAKLRTIPEALICAKLRLATRPGELEDGERPGGSVLERYALLSRGLFPETLPPCFTSSDIKRSLRGIVPATRAKALHRRPTDYVRYSSTKHDGSRRYFGTPNPVLYFYISEFISQHWNDFSQRYASSPFSVSVPRLATADADRPIIIPSLSELTSQASKNIGPSPFILKTDIAQFFPSIYTHSIPWAAHGIEAAKLDTSEASLQNYFNKLDFLTRNCQQAENRGILVGPDAFRLVAEYIAVGIDLSLRERVGDRIVGGARHVDDYYLGLRNETDGLIVLSALRDILQRYGLNINDSKTRILSGLDPLNELWAQELRRDARRLNSPLIGSDEVIILITKAIDLAKIVGSESPIKIALRGLDQTRAYSRAWWDVIEPYLQRIAFHYSHSLDYICLLVVKRHSIQEDIDRAGWSSTVASLIRRHLAFNHHHEIVWLLWLAFSCGLEVAQDLIDEVSGNDNAHIRALLVQAFVDGKLRESRKSDLEAAFRRSIIRGSQD